MTASLIEAAVAPKPKFIMPGKSKGSSSSTSSKRKVGGKVGSCCCLELSTLAPVGLGGALSTEAAEPPRP